MIVVCSSMGAEAVRWQRHACGTCASSSTTPSLAFGLLAGPVRHVHGDVLCRAANVGRERTSHRVHHHDLLRVLPGQPGHAVDSAAMRATPPSAQWISSLIGQPGDRASLRKWRSGEVVAPARSYGPHRRPQAPESAGDPLPPVTRPAHSPDIDQQLLVVDRARALGAAAPRTVGARR